MNIKISTVCITILFLFVSSCSTNGTGHQNPMVPSETEESRQALWFNSVQPLFDTSTVTADVDTASVVWGFASTLAQDIPGELVVFDDDTQWAVAVAIQERDPEYQWPGGYSPYLPASYPVIQFLGADGSTLSDVFPVPVFPNPNPNDPEFFEHYCFTPKVDCTYTYFEGVDEITKEPIGVPRLVVVVTYRHGSNTYSWNDILGTWDIRVTRMPFSYEVPLTGCRR